MKQELNFWVIGGDLRQEKLAQLLAEDGHSVHTYALERANLPKTVERMDSLDEVRRANCVVLPLPVMGEGGALNTPMSEERHLFQDMLPFFTTSQLICGGMMDATVQKAAAEKGLTLVDYFRREELVVANAALTAEGAVQIALEEMGRTLHRARVLVLGFGRVGKLTAHRMAALGAHVTVAARKYDALAWAEAYGYQAQRLCDLTGYLCGYDLVVNTVPQLVLTRDLLEDLKDGCLVMDLASKPGGVDFPAAADLGVRVIWALSLPGKVAPVTAGEALRDTIYNILRELS